MDYKLDKILRNFWKGLFWDICMVLVIFEFEICALTRFFITTLNVRSYMNFLKQKLKPDRLAELHLLEGGC